MMIVADVLIELGDVSPGRAPDRPVERRARPRPYRAVLTALTALLVAGLTGAAHRPAPAPPVVVEARLGDLMFVGDGQVFVVSAGAELPNPATQNKIISAYALPDGELMSRTTVTVTGAIFNVVAVGAVVLVSYQVDSAGAEATVALTEGTDRAIWRQPARLLAVSEPDGLALLRENSPQFGDLNWSGIAVRTGEIRWNLRRPPRGVIVEAGMVDGFPRHLVTATADGDLAVHDARTGAVTATARAPVRAAADADVPVWPTDDLLLVGAPEGTAAYELPTLVRRWQSDLDLAGRWVQESCVTVLCTLSRQGGLIALDPATGAESWSAERWTYAEQVGPYLLAGDSAVSSSRQSMAVLDPATGRVRGVFTGWYAAGEVGPDGTVLGLRDQLGDDIIWHARLDPVTLTLRQAGRAEEVSGDCQVSRDPDTGDVLVCRRIDATVGIWSLK